MTYGHLTHTSLKTFAHTFTLWLIEGSGVLLRRPNEWLVHRLETTVQVSRVG